MVDENMAQRSTAFTVSIEARTGISTGISAQDRAWTIRTAVAPEAKAEHLVSPGHVFPLRAKPGGILQRMGHTEGSVDLARLAGFSPAGVICEIMNEDGTMARSQDLGAFALKHGLQMISIADLVSYRLQIEDNLEVATVEGVQLLGKPWKATLLISKFDGREFLALQYGTLDADETYVRMHATSALLDVAQVEAGERPTLTDAANAIVQKGKGVIVLIAQPFSFAADFKRLLKQSVEKMPDQTEVLREFGMGAQVLRKLGLKRIKLLSKKQQAIVGLEAFGLELMGWEKL